jgi:hypothetical protein
MGAAMKPQKKPPRGAHYGSPDYTADTIVAGKYRLLYPLGEGGMGSVWAAHSSALNINVALKLIRLETASEEAPLRMIQEAHATARLADPGIVRLFDMGSTERGDPFIAMELLTGSTLHTTLEAGPLPAVRAVRLLLPIVRALETAHRAGVVHRDIKPDNIFFAVGARGDLQPKLVDFGVAKLLTNQNQLTHVGAVVGSPQYMSPEQTRGEAIDHRTDLWSVCVVLYEALVGAPPFTASNTHALLHTISTKEFKWGTEPAAPDAKLAEIIRKGLANEREQRWQHARELMLALAEWLRSQGVTEDITGVALRGRGLGQKSSLPGPSFELTGEVKRRTLETALNVAAPILPDGSSRAARPASSPEPVELEAAPAAFGERRGYKSRVWWAAVLALSVLGALAGASLSRARLRSEEINAPPAVASAPAVLLFPKAEAEPPLPAELDAKAAPALARDSEQPPPRSPAAPASRRPSPPRVKLTPAAQRPKAAPVPFKNPFE